MNLERVKEVARSRAPRTAKVAVKKLRNSLRQWLTRISAETYPDLSRGSQLAPTSEVSFPHVTAACILDEFSYSAWAPEFQLRPIAPTDGVESLDEVDLLLVESAWAGNNGQWRYQLTGKHAPSRALRDLVARCNERGIPTVFWNKEDPPHFEDFIDTARLFDIVFTSDSTMIPRYQEVLGHDRVRVLTFAAQPIIHNPARNGVDYAKGDLAFAGTYFRNKFPERRAQMDLLLSAAADVSTEFGLGFTIFSRHAGGDEKYQFPPSLQRHVAGSLPYPQMLAAYRSFKVFLNVNSVVDSPSMCARRIFEILASGSAVVSTPSLAVGRFFSPEEVPVVESPEEARRMLRGLVASPLLRDRMIHRAQRRIWTNHTYTNRAHEVLTAVGLEIPEEATPLVSVICSTNRDSNLQHLLNQVSQQIHPRIELLVLGHGLDIDPEFEHRAREAGVTSVQVLHAPPEATLGDCLNQLVRASSGTIIAKFDDDDHYLPYYLYDQLAALRYTGANLVGKASIYFHLARLDVIVRRWPQKEHKWTDFVAGATFVGHRSLFESVPFRSLGSGEDSAFLTDISAAGASIYSADRFNYMATRNEQQAHTWGISDEEILSYSQVETYGLSLSHVTA